MRRALALAASAAVACAHAPPPAPAPPAPPRPALEARVGTASYPDLDGSYQVPQVADGACLERAIPDEAMPPGPGGVLLRFGVAADGTVDDARVLANTTGGGPATLRAVEAAVRACRWIPARNPQGRRVRVDVELPFAFEPRAR